MFGKGPPIPSRRATIVIDATLPPHEIQVGGVLVLTNPSLADLGWMATSSIVRVPTSIHATGVEAGAPDVSFRRFDPETGYLAEVA